MSITQCHYWMTSNDTSEYKGLTPILQRRLVDRKNINIHPTRASTLNNGKRFSPNVNTINIAVFTLYSLGLPDNLLVIAVYVRNMTSTLTIYMFALASADLYIYVCLYICMLC